MQFSSLRCSKQSEQKNVIFGDYYANSNHKEIYTQPSLFYLYIYRNTAKSKHQQNQNIDNVAAEVEHKPYQNTPFFSVGIYGTQ